MPTRAFLAVAASVATAVLVGAGSAFAGESQGNFGTTGNYTPIENDIAASICSFSGQNPEAYLSPSDPNYEPGRTQSWGQLVKLGLKDALTAEGLAPGQSCNGHTGLFAGGGSE